MNKKIIIATVSILFLTVCTIPSLADTETDTSDDVLHWHGTSYLDWNWNVGDRPNIDIVEITYTAGDRLTISMRVDGTINQQKSWYQLWFNTTDAFYHLSYMPDDETEPFATATPLNFEDFTLEDLMNYTEPTIETSVNGDTITATIDWVTSNHNYINFFGWAQEWDNVGESFSDYYIDFAPNDSSSFGSYEDYYGDDSGSDDTGSTDSGDTNNDQNTESTSSNGTPGFEVIALIAGIALVMIALRKRK